VEFLSTVFDRSTSMFSLPEERYAFASTKRTIALFSGYRKLFCVLLSETPPIRHA